MQVAYEIGTLWCVYILCIYVYIYIRVYVALYLYMQVYLYVYVYVYLQTLAYIYMLYAHSSGKLLLHSGRLTKPERSTARLRASSPASRSCSQLALPLATPGSALLARKIVR